MIFILQKGLMAETLVPVFWNRKENTICQFDVKVKYQGKEFSVLPFVVAENKVIAKLVDADEELDSDNPVFVVLKNTFINLLYYLCFSAFFNVVTIFLVDL